MYVFITYIQTFFDTLEQHYLIKQIAVRLPCQKYGGPKSAHYLSLTLTENQGLNIDLNSQKHGCGSSRSEIVELELGITLE
jgi:hypothetical protein